MTETLEPPPLPKVLLPGETTQLAQCEQTIERGLAVFYEVGAALSAIRDKRLYRAEFATFEDYCQARWGIKASRARQLCDTAGVVLKLGKSVTSGNTLVLPANERQVRPLLKLPESERSAAWSEALISAPNGDVTGAHVERIVLARLGQSAPLASSLPESPETQPERKPAPSAAPIGRAARLLNALAEADSALQELVAEIGTPDSEAASEVVRTQGAIRNYQHHLEQMGKFHAARK